MPRFWERERLRDLPLQIDLWLPAESGFLGVGIRVGIRVRNPHDRAVPASWWSKALSDTWYAIAAQLLPARPQPGLTPAPPRPRPQPLARKAHPLPAPYDLLVHPDA